VKIVSHSKEAFEAPLFYNGQLRHSTSVPAQSRTRCFKDLPAYRKRAVVGYWPSQVTGAYSICCYSVLIPRGFVDQCDNTDVRESSHQNVGSFDNMGILFFDGQFVLTSLAMGRKLGEFHSSMHFRTIKNPRCDRMSPFLRAGRHAFAFFFSIFSLSSLRSVESSFQLGAGDCSLSASFFDELPEFLATS